MKMKRDESDGFLESFFFKNGAIQGFGLGGSRELSKGSESGNYTGDRLTLRATRVKVHIKWLFR